MKRQDKHESDYVEILYLKNTLESSVITWW